MSIFTSGNVHILARNLQFSYSEVCNRLAQKKPKQTNKQTSTEINVVQRSKHYTFTVHKGLVSPHERFYNVLNVVIMSKLFVTANLISTIY